MANVAAEQFFPEFAVELPGASDALLRRTLVDVARTFCNRTHVWQAKATVPFVEGAATYAVFDGDADLRDIAEIAWLQEVKLPQDDGQKVLPPDKDANPPVLGYPPRSCEVIFPASVLFRTIPTAVPAGHTFYVDAVLRPRRLAAELPDFLLDRHGEALAYGVKAKLMAMQDQPFSKPDGVQFNAGKFHAAITEALREVAVKGFGPRAVVVAANPWR